MTAKLSVPPLRSMSLFQQPPGGLEGVRLGTSRIHSIGREQLILTCFPARAQLMS